MTMLEPKEAIAYVVNVINCLQVSNPHGRFVFHDESMDMDSREDDQHFRMSVKCAGEDPAREPPEYYFRTMSRDCDDDRVIAVTFQDGESFKTIAITSKHNGVMLLEFSFDRSLPVGSTILEPSDFQ